MGGVVEWAKPKEASACMWCGSCDVLTPTPSSYPYGYSTWAGGASVGEAWLEIGWADDGVDLLDGAVKAIG